MIGELFRHGLITRFGSSRENVMGDGFRLFLFECSCRIFQQQQYEIYPEVELALSILYKFIIVLLVFNFFFLCPSSVPGEEPASCAFPLGPAWRICVCFFLFLFGGFLLFLIFFQGFPSLWLSIWELVSGTALELFPAFLRSFGGSLSCTASVLGSSDGFGYFVGGYACRSVVGVNVSFYRNSHLPHCSFCRRFRFSYGFEVLLDFSVLRVIIHVFSGPIFLFSLSPSRGGKKGIT